MKIWLIELFRDFCFPLCQFFKAVFFSRNLLISSKFSSLVSQNYSFIFSYYFLNSLKFQVMLPTFLTLVICACSCFYLNSFQWAYYFYKGFPGGSDGKESTCNAGNPGKIQGRSPGEGRSREDPLEKGMATHSSILAWRIPWTEESGGLQSMGS